MKVYYERMPPEPKAYAQSDRARAVEPDSTRPSVLDDRPKRMTMQRIRYQSEDGQESGEQQP